VKAILQYIDDKGYIRGMFLCKGDVTAFQRRTLSDAQISNPNVRDSIQLASTTDDAHSDTMRNHEGFAAR
jgi:hypothetical protein